MSAAFQEIDRRQTPMGEISVRRRLEPTLLIDVYEVKLGDEFLMTSLFTASEIELAKLALAELPGADLDIIVGGLGLGYTARAVLEDPRVQRVHVIEALAEVIDWHQQHLLPHASLLTADPRCRLVNGDFFATIAAGSRFTPDEPERSHAILVDIDHTPRHVLQPSHAPFYEQDGLRRIANRLHRGGIFALWSDDPPDTDYIAVVEAVFGSCQAHVVTFPNFYTGGEGSDAIYITKAGPA